MLLNESTLHDEVDDIERPSEEYTEEKTSSLSGEKSGASDLTREQHLFLLGLNIISKIEARAEAENRELTFMEKDKIDSVKTALWKSVVKYGIGLIHEKIQKYRHSKDAYADITQSMSLRFFQVLRSYDPTLTTPTTYFKPYFLESISKYVRDFSQNLRQNDQLNVAKVRKVINDYAVQGIKNPDVAMIAAKAELSLKVVTNTINIMNNTIYLNIDDCLGVASNQLSPEDEVIKSLSEQELYKAINSCLTTEEKEMFYFYVNINEKENKTYKEIAEHYGIAIHEAKSKISNIISILATDDVISKYNPYHNDDDYTSEPKLSLFENSADDVADAFLDILSNNPESIDLHTYNNIMG